MQGKYIYKITNNINGQVYIGQSIHPEVRWAEHRKNKHSKIGKAIQKDGFENFSFQIIEFAGNYTERENYWIDFYNSIEMGYNASKAVYAPLTIENNLLEEETVRRIETLLLDPKKTYEDIMKEVGCASETITKINRGLHVFSLKNREYPISNRYNNTKYNKDIVLLIIEDLKYTDLTIKEIAEKYQITNKDKVSEINLGKHHNCPENVRFPIRPKNFAKTLLSIDEIKEIEDLLLTTTLSYNKIGIMYNSNGKVIKKIDEGNFKGSYVFHQNYPLRGKTCND